MPMFVKDALGSREGGGGRVALGPKQGLGVVLSCAGVGSSVFQSHPVMSVCGRS